MNISTRVCCIGMTDQLPKFRVPVPHPPHDIPKSVDVVAFWRSVIWYLQIFRQSHGILIGMYVFDGSLTLVSCMSVLDSLMVS